jgi:hypothetical protein
MTNPRWTVGTLKNFIRGRTFSEENRKSLGLVYINTGPSHVIWFYCCPYTCVRIELNVSPSVIDIPQQFHVHYIPLIVPYTPHVTPFSLYQHWTLSCHMILLLFIYRIRIELNVSHSVIDIPWRFHVRYITLIVSYTPHFTPFSQYNHWNLSCHMILVLPI